MGQRVHFARPRPWSMRNAVALWFERAADDVDTLIGRYEMLHSHVNSSPAIIAAGDEKIEPLAIFYCKRCGGTRSRVAHCTVERSRRGRGAVFSVLALRNIADGDAEIVPTVIAAPSDIKAGRPPAPTPRAVVTECRSHGRVTINSRRALRDAQRTLAWMDNNPSDTPRAVPKTWI